MNPAARLIIAFVIRLLLIFFAGWFALAESAMPEGTHIVSRIGLAMLFLIASILVGEVSNLRMHFGMLVNAIRAARGGGEESVPDASPPDPNEAKRKAVDELVRALRTDKADVRDMVHGHLIRLTGQDLPADPAAWEAWWSKSRDTFVPR
ncbi:MAG: hypothetical protein QNJ98_07490 [Planctomycetota bacterium]|nr:hypothetical protein [Planctomycetota bacterium]